MAGNRYECEGLNIARNEKFNYVNLNTNVPSMLNTIFPFVRLPLSCSNASLTPLSSKVSRPNEDVQRKF